LGGKLDAKDAFTDDLIDDNKFDATEITGDG